MLSWLGAVLGLYGFVLVAKVASVLERRRLTTNVNMKLRF